MPARQAGNRGIAVFNDFIYEIERRATSDGEVCVKRTVLIRFVGERGKAYHYLKLGPMDLANPLEREFQGGDEVLVRLEDTPGKPDCVDICFEEGEFAIEVPKEFFEIVDDMPGR
jgi:hypothetical protein